LPLAEAFASQRARRPPADHVSQRRTAKPHSSRARQLPCLVAQRIARKVLIS
jgi:hypothetical protein